MKLNEALAEIERLESELEKKKALIKKKNKQLKEKDAQIFELQKKKNAGRPVRGESWQRSYDAFAKLYEQGIPMSEIIDNVDASRRTCYRYKAYYDSVNAK